jgi:UDP-N-acetylmuramate dehydrogenase
MNAGVSEKRIPREFCEIVDWVEVMRMEGGKPLRVSKPASEIVWSYRHSSGWQPGVITRVGIAWPNLPDENIPALVKEVNRRRLSKQPLDLPSGGSVFVNPPGEKAAGALIDECGFKGFTIGGARVSEKHANFIVNIGGANAKDIHSVIQEVKQGVLVKTGVLLSTEVVYLGNWP